MIQPEIRIRSGLIVLVSILQIALLARERNIRPAVSADPVKQPSAAALIESLNRVDKPDLLMATAFR